MAPKVKKPLAPKKPAKGKNTKGGRKSIEERVALERRAKVDVIFTAARKQKYLDEYAKTGLKVASAKKAGVSFMTIARHLKRDRDFALAVEAAKDEYNDTLEREIHRRAVKGVLQPVFGSKGKGKASGKIGQVRKYSDSLLMFHTKKHIPEYRDNVTVHSNVKGMFVHGTVPEMKAMQEWAADASAERSGDDVLQGDAQPTNQLKRG